MLEFWTLVCVMTTRDGLYFVSMGVTCGGRGGGLKRKQRGLRMMGVDDPLCRERGGGCWETGKDEEKG